LLLSRKDRVARAGRGSVWLLATADGCKAAFGEQVPNIAEAGLLDRRVGALNSDNIICTYVQV
jgi:hypothetical protein